MQPTPDEARLRHVVPYLAGVTLGTASITLLFLGMRAVMDIGGACAEGGPFVPVQPCPEGVELAMLGGTLGLFGAAGLMIWSGGGLGGRYTALVLLGWPALFISLGWNFLEYGVAPSGDAGLEWGWLVPGVLFVLMGGVPIVVVLGALRGGSSSLPAHAARLNRLRSRSADSPWAAATTGLRPDGSGRSGAPDAGPSGLVDQLERLTSLHDQGAIDDAEFAAAKRRLLGDGVVGQ